MSHSVLPRLLIVDPTPLGFICATSQLRQAFIAGWPQDAFLQVWYDDSNGPQPLRTMTLNQSYQERAADVGTAETVFEQCVRFKPDVVYFRPVESGVLLGFVERLLEAVSVPLVVHMMDDWPERLRLRDPQRFAWLDAALRRILARARRRLSIGTHMARAYAFRYGGYWLPLANGVDLADFEAGRKKSYAAPTAAAPFVIRYMGSLASDMTCESVRDVARTVAALQDECPVRLEIYTGAEWLGTAATQLAAMAGVSVHPLVDASEYAGNLCTADALLIAYNFDAASVAYSGLSLANKMPECLVSGAPVLGYGPPQVATIAYLRDAACAELVLERDPSRLRDAIKSLAMQPERRRELADLANSHAAKRLARRDVQHKFRQYISFAATPPGQILVGPCERKHAAHYDETQCIAYLCAGAHATGKTMVDVGAHYGSALLPFLNKGWRVHAFEPDDANRARLLDRVAGHPYARQLTVDTRCVSNKTRQGLSFYRSAQSSGISGLSAFHESHVEAQQVDTVTLADFFGQKTPAVDFLKIDTEGHDLFVLQGFPWDRSQPAIIECEFEDAKTLPLGYDFHDLAGFLADKGYTVYASEWHPIVRYGIRHDWRSLAKYPCRLQDEKSWGNLLAFREPPDEIVLSAAVRQLAMP